MTNLKGKNALVTGGSKGMGKAVALHLAKEGVNVAITGRNQSELQATVKELEALGVKAMFAAFDIADHKAVAENVTKISKEMGSIDILINNAGIGNFGSIEDMPIEVWEQVIRTNLFGVYYMAKAVAPLMKAQGQGDIVNVASTAGLKGAPNMSAYCASKAAVISLSQSLMAEYRKHNLRVITLTPSTIATELSINNKLTDGNPEKVLQVEDFAQWVTDILKMNRRALIANAAIFSTNP